MQTSVCCSQDESQKLQCDSQCPVLVEVTVQKHEAFVQEHQPLSTAHSAPQQASSRLASFTAGMRITKKSFFPMGTGNLPLIEYLTVTAPSCCRFRGPGVPRSAAGRDGRRCPRTYNNSEIFYSFQGVSSSIRRDRTSLSAGSQWTSIERLACCCSPRPRRANLQLSHRLLQRPKRTFFGWVPLNQNRLNGTK